MSESRVLSSLVKRIKNKDEDPLSHLVDEYLITRDNSPNRLKKYTINVPYIMRPPGRIGASTVAGCLRQAAFTFLGVRRKKKINPDREMMFDDGHWRHHRWQAMFLDMQEVLGEDRFKVLSIEESVKFPEIYTVGHLDARVEIEDFGETVIDIKGANQWAFSYVIMNNRPDPTHAKQLNTYIKGKDIPIGFILYDSKNDQRTRICAVENDKAIWAEIEGWCIEVIDYLESLRLPPKHPDCNRGKFLYENCPFAYICFAGKSDKAIHRYMYRDFPGVKKLWKIGNKMEREARRAAKEEL